MEQRLRLWYLDGRCLMCPSYSPPIENLVPPIAYDRPVNRLAMRLASYYSTNPQGINCYLKYDGTATFVEPYDPQATIVRRTLHGGHLHYVTSTEKTAIQTAESTEGHTGTHLAFDPRTSPGLVWWLDAGSLNLSNDDPVSSWPSLVEETHIPALTQGVSSRQPLFKTNVLNGQPVVRFDGTDDYLSASWPIGLGAPYTLLIVMSVTSTTGTVVMDQVGSPGRGRGLILTTASSKLAVTNFSADGSSAGQFVPTSANLPLAASVASVIVDTDYRISHAINGSAVAGALTLTPNQAMSPPAIATMFLGARFSVANFTACDIAEICLWNRVLPADELANQVTDARTKYGL